MIRPWFRNSRHRHITIAYRFDLEDPATLCNCIEGAVQCFEQNKYLTGLSHRAPSCKTGNISELCKNKEVNRRYNFFVRTIQIKCPQSDCVYLCLSARTSTVVSVKKSARGVSFATDAPTFPSIRYDVKFPCCFRRFSTSSCSLYNRSRTLEGKIDATIADDWTADLIILLLRRMTKL